MILEELVLHNFGLYRDRQVVDLRPISKHKPIILFGGLNGGGKTTLVDALQLALYGKSANCSNRGTLSYDDYLRRSVNRDTDLTEGAAVELQFRHVVDGSEHVYRIHRSWCLRGKGIKETVEVVCDGTLDHVLTEAWQEQVEEFIPVRISHLFFFDGEKIESLADAENSAQLLTTAVHSLLGLDIVDRLLTDLTVVERRKQSSLKSNVEKKQLQTLTKELEKIDATINDFTIERGSQATALIAKEKALRALDTRLRNEGSELLKRRHEIEGKRLVTTTQLAAVDDELCNIASGATPLLLITSLLQKVQQRDTLEEQFAKQTLLVEILDERDATIVERAQNAGLDKTALRTIKDILEQDREKRRQRETEKSFLSLSDDARQRLSQLFNNHEESVSEILKYLESAETLQSSIVRLDRQLASVPEPEGLEELTNEKENCVKAVSKISVRLETIDGELARAQRARASLVNKIKDALELEFENDDQSRIIHHSKKLRDTMGKFRSALIKRDVDKFEHLILDSFKQLLRKQTLVSSLRIDPETFAVELHGKDNRLISTERFSAGERQLLAVAMLWGLARAVGRPLPAVIDTPLGRLDSVHREHLVTRYFPRASHQVILLSTDEEISESYLSKLKNSITRSYRLDYDEQTMSTRVNAGYFW